MHTELVQRFDLLTLVAYHQCTIYVLDLCIKCNTLMLNFGRAEYVGGEKGDFGSPAAQSQTEIVGVADWSYRNFSLWVTWPAAVMTFPFIGLRWIFLCPQAWSQISPTLSWTHLQDSSVSTSALKSSSSQTNLLKNDLTKGRAHSCTVSKHIWACLLDRPALYLLLPCCRHICWPLSTPTLPTDSYKTQVCKHKDLLRPHKWRQIRQEEERNENEGGPSPSFCSDLLIWIVTCPRFTIPRWEEAQNWKLLHRYKAIHCVTLS